MKVSRRAVAGAVAGAPLLMAAASAAKLGQLLGIAEARAAQDATPLPSPSATPPEDSPLGRFLAREDDGLSADERKKIRKQVAQMEQSLAKLRSFTLTNDVPPAGTFKALRTVRHGR